MKRSTGGMVCYIYYKTRAKSGWGRAINLPQSMESKSNVFIAAIASMEALAPFPDLLELSASSTLERRASKSPRVDVACICSL